MAGKKIYYLYVSIFVLFTSLFLFFTFEGRIFDFSELERIRETHTDLDELESRMNIFKELKENAPNKTKNSFGFYDEEWEKEKDDDTFRIAAVGDSMTAGVYIRNNETWPKQLERRLNSEFEDINFEVMNMGEGGIGMKRKNNILHDYALEFDPDMVILQYFWNDWTSPKVEDRAKDILESNDYVLTEGKKEIVESFESDEYREEVKSRIIYGQERAKYMEDIDPRVEWEKWVRPYLTEFIETTSEKNISLITITWSFVSWQEEKFTEIKDEYNLTFHDYSGIIPEERPSKYRLKDGHLTGYGYEIVANNTYTKIKDMVGK